MVTVERVRIETKIHAIKGKVLLYTAMIDSFNMNDPAKAVTGLVNPVADDLESWNIP